MKCPECGRDKIEMNRNEWICPINHAYAPKAEPPFGIGSIVTIRGDNGLTAQGRFEGVYGPVCHILTAYRKLTFMLDKDRIYGTAAMQVISSDMVKILTFAKDLEVAIRREKEREMNMTKERTSKTEFKIGDQVIETVTGLPGHILSVHIQGLSAQVVFNDELGYRWVCLADLEPASLSDLQKLKVKLKDITSVKPGINSSQVGVYNAYLHVISMIEELEEEKRSIGSA